MAKLVFALNQSLDGYVDQHEAFAPDLVLFRHFVEDMRSLAGLLHGRRMYETMRYWGDEQPDWGEDERAFAAAWRAQPKWVVARTRPSVGPEATLITGELEAAVRRLKADVQGDIEVAGPELAGGLTELGLIDEYRLYIHPIVLGSGKPFFTGPRPRLRLAASERIGAEVIRLTYAPA